MKPYIVPFEPLDLALVPLMRHRRAMGLLAHTERLVKPKRASVVRLGSEPKKPRASTLVLPPHLRNLPPEQQAQLLAAMGRVKV